MWLLLALKDHSNLNGENRLQRGSTNVQEREGGGESQLGGHQKQKSGSSPPHNSSALLLPSHFPQCGDLGQLTFLLLWASGSSPVT